ncbi:MAG: Transcription antitermination protein NusG, partial [uncultured Solirubrobacteraceae bacterium]
VPLVRRQHLLRTREQGQAEHRAPRRVARPEAPHPPGRGADGDRVRDEGQPEGDVREADDAGLRPGEHGAQRGLLAAREGHAGRHRVRRGRAGARPPHPARGGPPAAPRGRAEGRHEGAVLHRRVGEGGLRAALGLLRGDLRGPAGRLEAQGACVNLRPRDAGRGWLRSGQEDL